MIAHSVDTPAQITPFMTLTKCTVLIKTNMKWCTLIQVMHVLDNFKIPTQYPFAIELM